MQFQKISIHPPPNTEGQWKFRWGGGLKDRNLRRVGGCSYDYTKRVISSVLSFTKKDFWEKRKGFCTDNSIQ